MRFGLQIESYGESDAFDRMLAVARLAKELGFESIWYEDHFSLVDDERPEEPWPQLECLTTLAALAASTRRIGIGALVVGVPYRNPALLAKTWTTLDVISHGRIIVGLGAGWNEHEFEAYGYGTVAERMERLEDAVRICDEMMRRSPATHEGMHHSIRGARNDPPPVRRPRPPILVGGNGEKRTLRLVARYADMCNVYGSSEDVRRKFEALRRHCEEIGRPYAEVTRTINHWALLARDDTEKAEKRERFPQTFSVDTPAEAVAELEEYEAAGAQYAIVKILDAADLDPVRLFAEEVMKAFR
ncbi:MAG: TIGR03560 family F420-dependent LLM class oxidoreductase [Rubrobacter sp.]